jgi:hypothetical protein
VGKQNAPAKIFLSPEQRLAQLDARLGVGVGAQRERAKLTKAIEVRKHDQTEDFLALAGVFFYLKFMRRRSLSPDYVQPPVFIEADLNGLQLGRLGIDLDMELNLDVEGKAGDTIPPLLINFPYRFELLGYLSDAQILFVCGELDSLFEQQEFCAQCESWSHYEDTTAYDFAVYNAAWMLSFLNDKPAGSISHLFKDRVTIPPHPGRYDEWRLPKMIEEVLAKRLSSLKQALPVTTEAGT